MMRAIWTDTYRKKDNKERNKRIKLVRFRPEWFETYGLDKEKNFMETLECECGCGSKCRILLKNQTELLVFMGAMLEENDCMHCAMFAHAFDGKMYTVIKSEDIDIKTDKQVLCFMAEDTDMEFFKNWNRELGFHCYGLIIETKKGQWKIIED